MIDIVVRVDLCQVRQRPISQNSVSTPAYVAKEFIIIVDKIAKYVSDFLNGVVIVHSKTFREDESLGWELHISLIIVVNVSLLGEELWASLCRHDKFIHLRAHLSIGFAVCSACVLLELITCVDKEIPVVAREVWFVSTIVLEINRVAIHISTLHIMNLVIKLGTDSILSKDLGTGNWHVVLKFTIR